LLILASLLALGGLGSQVAQDIHPYRFYLLVLPLLAVLYYHPLQVLPDRHQVQVYLGIPEGLDIQFFRQGHHLLPLQLGPLNLRGLFGPCIHAILYLPWHPFRRYFPYFLSFLVSQIILLLLQYHFAPLFR